MDEAFDATLESEAATAPDDIASHVAWRSVRAKVLAARGETEHAERLAREAVAAAEDMGPHVRGDAAIDLAVVLFAAGKRDSAMRSMQEAQQTYADKGIVPGVARAARLGRDVAGGAS